MKISLSKSISLMICMLASQVVALSPVAAQSSGTKSDSKEGRGEQKNESKSESRGDAKGDSKGDSKSSSKGGTDISEIIAGLDYPELQVVPRASERLRIEAKEEDSTWFVMHWPIEVSGLATLAVGLMGKSQQRDGLTDKEKNDANSIATVTQAVGVGWLAAGLALGMQRPYRSGLNTISKLGGKDERSVLLRERLAEEALERPARFMEPVLWASVLSNFGLNMLSAVYLSDQGRVIAGVSSVLAFLPFLFEDHTITVYNKHIEYKKKIYGPLTSTGLGYDQKSQTFYPTANLSWTF